MVLGAAYVLDGYRRTFFGPLGHNAIGAAADLRPRELLVAIAFSLPILAAGLYPAGVLDTLSASTSQWVERFATRAP